MFSRRSLDDTMFQVRNPTISIQSEVSVSFCWPARVNALDSAANYRRQPSYSLAPTENIHAKTFMVSPNPNKIPAPLERTKDFRGLRYSRFLFLWPPGASGALPPKISPHILIFDDFLTRYTSSIDIVGQYLI